MLWYGLNVVQVNAMLRFGRRCYASQVTWRGPVLATNCFVEDLQLRQAHLHGDGLVLSGYDNDGTFSTIANSTTTYVLSYDGLNRMATTRNVNGTASASFAYDGDGKRLERIFNGQSTKYIYDGTSLIGTVNSDGSVSYFIPGVGAVWANGPPQYYWQENAQGATLNVRTGSGSLTSRTDYDAFGNPYVAVQGPQTFLGYGGAHGYVTDSDSDWMMLGVRYYIPFFGRFVTQDPSGYEAGLNLYAYCDNNPVISVDPTGLNAGTDWHGIPGARSGEFVNMSSRSVTVWGDMSFKINGVWEPRRIRLDVPPGYRTNRFTIDIDYIPRDSKNGEVSSWTHIIPSWAGQASAYDYNMWGAHRFTTYSSFLTRDDAPTDTRPFQFGGPTNMGDAPIYNMGWHHAANAGIIEKIPHWWEPTIGF